MTLPRVSIIIPTYNEQNTIRNCLSSLFKQTYKSFEIIVVDDGSTDQTVSKLNQLAIDKTIHLFKQSHLGPGAARNLGVSKSRGSILVFVDADMTFDQEFIAKLIAPIISGNTIGTFTKDERVGNVSNPWAASWSLLRGFQSDRMHPADYPDHQLVFRAILKNSFLKAGGYTTNRGYDDDWTLSEKLGTEATSAPGAIIYHTNPVSLNDIFTQSRWMAKRLYKYGLLGTLFALIRASLPFSLIFALILSLKHTNLHLFLAKLISDLGIFLGIIHLLLTHSTSK